MRTEYDHLLIDRVGTDARVARITLNRPEVLNALAPHTWGELHAALKDLEADDSARVVVLRGAGRAFCVGHDLVNSPEAMASPDSSERSFRRRDERGRPLTFSFSVGLRQIADIQLYFWRMAKVTVVQTHGHCLAGGMELAMMGDLVTTSTDCVFGHPGHRSLGVARNGMLLPLVIGMRKAKELFLTGDSVTGAEAEDLGLVNYAWPAAELEDRTIALADRVAHQSGDFLALLKAGINGFYENMGVEASVRATTQLDAVAPLTGSAYEWAEHLRSDGLKGALAWRDGRYGDYSATPKEA